MSDNRAVHLSKHEVVLDRHSAENIWEIAFGEDAWDKGFCDNEVIEVLKSYEKKAHMYDQMIELVGLAKETLLSDLNYKTGEIADSDKVANIVVEGGMVVEVNGLPVDWQYYIDDRDCPPEIEDE